MRTPDFHELFLAPLEKQGIAYMVSGSVASIFYGEPRLTVDVDLALVVSAADAERIEQAFPSEAYYVPPVDVLKVEINRPQRGHFNVIHFESGLKADCYPSRNDPLFAWAVEHRQRGELGGGTAFYAPPEYVILWKLEFLREGGSDKHARDAGAMLRVSGDRIDTKLLREEIARRRLDAEWARVAPAVRNPTDP